MCLGETTPGKGIAAALHHCARDNLLRRGESAASCLFSPLPTVFSRALFSTPSPLLGETSALDCSQDFLCKIYSAPFCAASWEWAALHRIPKGDGEKGKWGTGGENPKGEGGSASLMRPPSLGLSPQALVTPFKEVVSRTGVKRTGLGGGLTAPHCRAHTGA